MGNIASTQHLLLGKDQGERCFGVTSGDECHELLRCHVVIIIGQHCLVMTINTKYQFIYSRQWILLDLFKDRRPLLEIKELPGVGSREVSLSIAGDCHHGSHTAESIPSPMAAPFY